MASFTDRLAVAAKALVGVFNEAAAKQAFGLLQGLFPGAAGAPPTRGARERAAAYADMPWLHAVADKVSSAVAAVEWQLKYVKPTGAARAVRVKALQRLGGSWEAHRARQARLKALRDVGELVEIAEHPLLDDVLDSGNEYMTGLAVRKTTALHWDLEGEAFWIKERSALADARAPRGVPIGVWPIPPHWIMATPTPHHPFFRVSFRGWQGSIPETEILWMANPNPENPYGRGTGMARALADELETDEYAAGMTRSVFFNQARPDFLIYPKGTDTWGPAERDRLEHDWRAGHEGFWRAMKARFMTREVGVHEFGGAAGISMRNLQMVQLREFERSMIIQVFGVPPEIMGIIESGASRATITQASYVFARWVLVPRLEAFRAVLQERLVPEYDDRLILDYVSPVEKDREFALEAHKATPWAWTVDEHRALVEDPPLDDGAGEVFPLTLGTAFGALNGGAEGALPPDEAAILRRLADRGKR